MNFSESKGFSKKWTLISYLVFIVIEILLGGLIGQFVVGKYMSISLHFMLQGLLNLVSFFIGGFLIAAISPSIRIWEPAVAAFFAVTTLLVLTFFTPYSFLHFSFTKMIIGGGIAFVLAMVGAQMGERITGRKRR